MEINEFKNLVSKEDNNIIAIDFDGVIHKNSKGFHDGTIYDEPVEGVKKGLEYLSKSYRLVVYSCKSNPKRPFVNEKNGSQLMAEWLEKHGLAKYIERIAWGKPNARYYIDDKAVRFINWNQTIEEIDA